MAFKQCENCQKSYPANPVGRLAMICRACSQDCEDAYMTIRKFLRDNNTAFKLVDSEIIAEAVGVPAIFILILAKEGRFGQQVLDELKKKPCKRCQNLVNDDERKDDMCRSCFRELAQQFT